MGRVTRREWYRRVNATWPAIVPPLTADEAVRAGKKLYRFVTKRTWTGPVRVTSGRRRNKASSRELVVNPEAGWRDIVHSFSHWLERYADASGHGPEHARLEMRMIREVVRRGWLDGRLRTPEKPVHPTPDKRSIKKQRTADAIERWEAKERRATNALKKLRRRLAYYERAMAAHDL